MAVKDSHTASPALVAIAGWLVPGAGYWLLRERCRAVTIGFCVVLLYLTGICIGGVRVIDVPGYGDHGRPLMAVHGRYANDGDSSDQATEDPPAGATGWVMLVHPLDEIRNKPWSIAQILAGPLDIATSAASVWASQPPPGSSIARGARSHARTAELGVLYTAVAGMLNLLAIIDSTYRSVEPGEDES